MLHKQERWIHTYMLQYMLETKQHASRGRISNVKLQPKRHGHVQARQWLITTVGHSHLNLKAAGHHAQQHGWGLQR